MRILKWPKKLKDRWRCQYNEKPKDSMGFGFRKNHIDANGPPIFGWKKPDDIFVEMGNAINAMIACLKDAEGYVIDENGNPVTINYEQALDWYLLCVNELRYKLCPKCATELIVTRDKMNLNEALKK